MDQYIDIKVRVWRQAGPKAQGHFETYELKHVFQGASFLEMIDILNEQLVAEHKDPVTYDHDCREGICGMCSMYVNGHPHGPDSAITTCQLHMRKFKDGEVNTGGVPDANAIPIPKPVADEAMDAASCIGCGACAAACKNGSAMLFVAAKVSQLALLPQGKIEAAARAKAMVAKMDELGFGNCTNTGACAAECPKSVSLANIARLNREFLAAKFKD